MSAFEEVPSADMVAVGAVGVQSVVVWLRAKQPGTHALEIWPDSRQSAARTFRFEVSADPCRDGTAAVRYPDDFPGAQPLEPGTEHGFRIVRERGAAELGEGRFETAPADVESAPDELAFAFSSCHQPFDESGEPFDSALSMLNTLQPAFSERRVKRVLLLGDQMYADYPQRFSLFHPEYFRRVGPPGRERMLDCTRAEIRAVYQRRYRAFWTVEGFQRLQADYPCYMMVDDHELVDNFGSAQEHSQPDWRDLHDGALDACYDYQLQRTLALPERPPSLHFELAYGPIAAFVMDLRSERAADERRLRIYGDEQLRALSRFLQRNAQRPVIAIGLSVPLVHIPKWLADAVVGAQGEGTDAADRWEYAKAKESREALVAVLARHRQAHPEQQLLLLSGDIHTGAISRIVLNGAPPAVQVVSSALTNVEAYPRRRIAELITRLQHETVMGSGDLACRASLLDGEPGANKNPYPGLNVGFLRCFRVGRREWGVRVELSSCDASQPGKPLLVYARDL